MKDTMETDDKFFIYLKYINSEQLDRDLIDFLSEAHKYLIARKEIFYLDVSHLSY